PPARAGSRRTRAHTLPARLDFERVRLLMHAEFSARHKFEMFYGVGDVDFFAVDASFLQGAVEHLSGGPDERLAGEVFLVASGPMLTFASLLGGHFCEC